MANFSWDGFGRLTARLAKLSEPDANPLMEEWERVIVEDNRRGVLAGQDKDGISMRPVTYRPRRVKGKRTAVTPAQRNNGRGVFAGLGPASAGFNNNLTSAEYRKLSGPPLAPRGASSRVITNLFTGHSTRPVNGVWFATGAWAEVVSTKGVPFLPYHFNGQGRNPIRDLRGVRPQGRVLAVIALQEWGQSLVKGTG